MENVIYNELRRRGFAIDVGIINLRATQNGESISRQYEVDFVANMGSRRYYLQSAFALPNEEKMRQETASLDKIYDSFKKIIITRDDIKPAINAKGYLVIGLFDFLLNQDSMDRF